MKKNCAIATSLLTVHDKQPYRPLLPIKVLKAPSMILMIRCYRSKPQFRVQRRQSNNANTWFNQIQKLLKLNISFIASNDFRRLRPVFYFIFFCNANILTQVSLFSYSCPKCQCPAYIFKNLCVDCFLYKFSSVW